MLQEALKEALKHVLIIIAIAMVTIVSMPIEKTYASTLEPTSDQKIEYRAISQEIVNGKKFGVKRKDAIIVDSKAGLGVQYFKLDTLEKGRCILKAAI